MKKEQPKDNKAIRESQRYYSNQHDQREENLRQDSLIPTGKPVGLYDNPE